MTVHGPGFGGGKGRIGMRLTEEEKKNAPKITGALLKRVFRYLAPYWPQMICVTLAILASSLFGLFPSILTGKIIDEGLIGRDLNRLVLLILLTVGVIVASNLITVLESYLNAWVAQRITYDMKNQMYRHLQQMSHRFYTTSKQGDIITRMTSDISGVQTVIANTLTSILSNFAILVTSVTALYQKNWILATIGIAIVPLFIIPTKKTGTRRWQIALQSQEKNDEANQILNETLSVSGQLLVKLFTNEEMEFHKFEKVNKETARLALKESMAGRWFRVAMSTFANLGPMLIYLVGGLLIIRYGVTSLTVGDITVMVALLSRMYIPVNQLLNFQVDVTRSMALFTRIFEYFDRKPEIENAPNPVVPERVQGDIRFEGVGFSYEKGQPVLEDVSFHVAPGRSVAIVGPSGAGKSTIINLIPRLYDVTEGRVLCDGVDVRQMDLNSLRKSVGMVSQDTYLFNGTIRENLLYAKGDATQEELEQACKKANIHEFIQSQPKGYDSMVGNRGLKLSGGEKQRVSIARVILKERWILILDEATSALDSISESLIQDAIEPLLAGRTSIVIAHRLSTIMAADEILVVKDGKIVETGSHKELVEQDGVYRELYETQFRRALADRDMRMEEKSSNLHL